MTVKQYPEPVVGAFILNPQGKLFLMKSHKWKDRYVVPGGHIELGEKIEEALQREVMEETTLTVSDPKFLCIHEFISEEGFHTKKHMLFLNFLVKTKSTNVTLNDEAEAYIWVTIEEALKLPLEKYTKMTIEEHLWKNTKK